MSDGHYYPSHHSNVISWEKSELEVVWMFAMDSEHCENVQLLQKNHSKYCSR